MGWNIRLLILLSFLGTLLVTAAQARENPVNAVVLFEGPSGAAYVQVTGLLVNGKSELRICDGVPKISKSVYDGLQRIQLTGATSLERVNDGTLVLTVNSKTLCVVPGNLKFDRSAELTPAEAADQAVLQGNVISPSTPSSPSPISVSSVSSPSVSSSTPSGDQPGFKRGVRLVFVVAADDELAQYLLAQRVNSVAGWQDFLSRHASSGHAGDARNALAAVYEEAAESAFSKYEKSSGGQAVDMAALMDAQQQASQANKAVAGYQAASKLRARINRELDTLLQPDAARLQGFRKALAEHTSGYAQLATAWRHTGELLRVNPDYAPVVNLHSEVAGEVRKLEATIQQAEGAAAAKDYDQALQILGPYTTFASEAPGIDAIVNGAYMQHFQHGRQLAAEHDWEKAVAEFHRAAGIKGDSPEAAAALKDAELEANAVRDRQAAQRALAQSQQYAENKDFIEAYEVLVELPDGQRALVADQLAALEKDFVPAATRRAQKLEDIHIPIRGPADEDGAEEAYELLSHASSLSGDPALRVKLDLLSGRISAYYIDQAKRYLNKPVASGIGVGWLYLSEAERYKTNLSVIRDAMAQYAATYQLRCNLSIGVVLRDQTSRRDSAGFADQLADAIATGIESSGYAVKVARQANQGAQGVQPNFLLLGEILEHRVVKEAKLETLQSKYRAGTHDVKNEDWSKANEDYESTQKALQTAQRTLADAHGKKDMAAANDAVAAAQKRLDDARHKLDAMEPTTAQAVIEPYNYAKKSIDLTALIELTFRISDAQGNVIEAGTPVKKENHKRFVVLENVKPEDTEGIKSQGTEPDEIQFLADAELQARDAFVKSVRDQAMALPAKILEQARNKAQQNDVDGAAEAYIIYLNATADAPSQERDEAARFLRQHYNLTAPPAPAITRQAQAGIVSQR